MPDTPNFQALYDIKVLELNRVKNQINFLQQILSIISLELGEDGVLFIDGTIIKDNQDRDFDLYVNQDPDTLDITIKSFPDPPPNPYVEAAVLAGATFDGEKITHPSNGEAPELVDDQEDPGLVPDVLPVQS